MSGFKRETFTPEDVEILERERLYDGFLAVDRFSLKHRLFAGGLSEAISRELMVRKDAVAVLMHDPVRDAVVLIEQFRVGALEDSQTPWMLELVAGLMDTNETPEQIARRESMEEAGCELLSLKLIHEFYLSPGACNEKLYLFYAEVDARGLGGLHGLASENEDIKVHVLSCETAFELLKTGQMNNAIGIIALQWLQAYVNSGRERAGV